MPVAAIAVSTGLGDAGFFELDFRSALCLPFEGTGAVSQWSLELTTTRQFEYGSISSVVVQLRYTAVKGGR